MQPSRFSILTLAGAAIALAGLPLSTSAQGMLGIGREGSRVTQSIPVKVGVGAWAGYDSNANTASGGEAKETAFYGGRASLRYAYVTSQTRFDLRFQFTGLRQDAGGGSLDDMIYNSRLKADFGHRFNQRVSAVNNAMVAWEVEPDFMVAASSALRDDQYLYLWDRAAVWLSLTNRLTSVTSYAVEAIGFESNRLSQTEDRVTHTFGQQMRYAWSEQTSAKAEYRYGMTNYDSAPLDSKSHYLLAGVDQQFGQSALLTLLGGAEYRDYDAFDAIWKPYAEASLVYQVDDATTLRWLARAGLENAEVAGFENRYSIRTGVTASHALSDRLSASAGVAYVYSELEGEGSDRNVNERGVQAHADITYALLPNLDLSTGYQYTSYDSGNDDRDYDRHRLSVAATTTF
ncbi:MAG: outer membrane beta-barrel protein [Verrucomicrobiae bacterium]|nr:outer membrane beta-barrel protein [Verrucomicrobiae bacterium]